LRALRDQFGETVNLGHMQLDKVTWLEVVPSEFALRLHERPGSGVCLHARALGKAIPQDFMAELKRVREPGYAFDRGETSLQAT
jgi:DNA-binding IclR family transcriptional regulator